MFAYLSHTVIVILGIAQKKEVREQSGLVSVEIERNIYLYCSPEIGRISTVEVRDKLGVLGDLGL